MVIISSSITLQSIKFEGKSFFNHLNGLSKKNLFENQQKKRVLPITFDDDSLSLSHYTFGMNHSYMLQRIIAEKIVKSDGKKEVSQYFSIFNLIFNSNRLDNYDLIK